MNTSAILKQIADIMQLKIEQEMKLGRLLGQLLTAFNDGIAGLGAKVAELEKQIATKKELEVIDDEENPKA